jgi:ribosomal-protein-alanine N-acetyltransferase
VVIETLRWWHLDQVLAIEQTAFAGDRPWSAEQMWGELAGVPDTRVYVIAREQQVVCGYAGLAAGPDSGDVLTLAVRPDARRRGVGRALLAHLLGEAARRQVREVLLEVRADNGPALGLYRSAGFTRVAQRRGYYHDGTDGWVLRRRVGDG